MFRVCRLISFIILSMYYIVTSCLGGDSENKVLKLKNEYMTVIFLPKAGGKIISIKDSKGNEFLSRSDRPYKERQFGMKYGDTEFDGIDECFPSMGACSYPVEPYKGKPTGDHGEVCQLPWNRVKGKGITLEVKGVNFPYIFKRQATLDGKTLILDYTVTNTGDAPLYHSYVFHPLFKGETGCAIELEPETDVKVLYSTKNFLGKFGTTQKLADIKDDKGQLFYKNMFTKNRGRYYKFVVGKMKNGEAVYRLQNGAGVKLNWPASLMPYMAVWCSENGVKGLNHLAPEPAVSAFDSLAEAYKHNEARKIPANGVAKWQIKLTLIDKGK